MATLYDGDMALIYDAMYQTFIDYKEEYLFYKNIIDQNNCKSILEIGSGTGNLAKQFYNNNANYKGLDYSPSMIKIAMERNPNGTFICGDMRNFNIDEAVDSILITGRSTSYLILNEDVTNTFKSIFKNLTENGILVFDFIDANRFIPFFTVNKNILHEAVYNDVNYIRESKWCVQNLENFMVEWKATYYKIVNEEKQIISHDTSLVRIFTLNEIQLFLYLNGFEIIKTIDRKTYAYDTFVIVAKKIAS